MKKEGLIRVSILVFLFLLGGAAFPENPIQATERSEITTPQFSVSSAFVNGVSRLYFDQNGLRINLEVCADNLPGQPVSARLSRPGRTFDVVSLQASGRCVTFWDMDEAGPVLFNTTYTTRAALNREPDMTWPVPCAVTTGSQGLCDSASFPNIFVNGSSRLYFDQYGERINLEVCADNLPGQTVYVRLSGPDPTVTLPPQQASGRCVTFWDMSGEKPVRFNTAYTTKAALNQLPSDTWSVPCAVATGGQGLCDRASFSPSTPIVFVNGSSELYFDQGGERINLKVCADNLDGQTVFARLSRPNKTFDVVSQQASGQCVTFWDMDGAGPVLFNTTYTTRAALNQLPRDTWPVPCATATERQGLCDSGSFSPPVSNVFSNGSSRLYFDQYGARINLEVCADNLPGQTVYVRLFGPDPTATLPPQQASGRCVTFWDMSGDNPVHFNTVYTTKAALNQLPNDSWPVPCAVATGGQGLCDRASFSSSTLIVFVNGSSELYFDQDGERINLKVCADNLDGQTVYARLSRPGRMFEVDSHQASGQCVTFWDMDGPGPVLRDTIYTTTAALNQSPNEAWSVPCSRQTGGQGLCDRANLLSPLDCSRIGFMAVADGICVRPGNPLLNSMTNIAIADLTNPHVQVQLVNDLYDTEQGLFRLKTVEDFVKSDSPVGENGNIVKYFVAVNGTAFEEDGHSAGSILGIDGTTYGSAGTGNIDIGNTSFFNYRNRLGKIFRVDTSAWKYDFPVGAMDFIGEQIRNSEFTVGYRACTLDGEYVEGNNDENNVLYDRSAKTAIGISSDGKRIFMATADANISPNDRPTKMLADSLKSVGADRVIMLDGGGSPQFVEYGKNGGFQWSCWSPFPPKKVINGIVIYSDSPIENPSRLASVSPSGGEYALTSRVSIQFPQGTFSNTASISYVPQFPTATVGLGHIGEFHAVQATSAQGDPIQPELPYTISISYEQGQVPSNISEDELALYFWSGTAWQKAPSQVDIVNHVVTVSTRMMGQAAILAPIHYKVYLPLVYRNYSPVSAAFTASPLSGVAPLTVTFANDSTGNYTKSLWDLGNGVTSTLPSPTHIYTATGAYTITLTVSGAGESNTLVRPNYIAVLDRQPCGEKLANGGFEGGDGWNFDSGYPAAYTTTLSYSGSRSMRAGIVDPAVKVKGLSAFRQSVTLPSKLGSATLRFWLHPTITGTTSDSDDQRVLILDQLNNTMHTLVRQRSNTQTWTPYEFDVSIYAGKTFYVYFGTYNNGTGSVTAMYVDDVSLQVCPAQ